MLSKIKTCNLDPSTYVVDMPIFWISRDIYNLFFKIRQHPKQQHYNNINNKCHHNIIRKAWYYTSKNCATTWHSALKAHSTAEQLIVGNWWKKAAWAEMFVKAFRWRCYFYNYCCFLKIAFILLQHTDDPKHTPRVGSAPECRLSCSSEHLLLFFHRFRQL